MDFDPKRSSGSGSELSVGAQTLRTCATHQLGRLRKFERKIFTLGEKNSIFPIGAKSVLGSSGNSDFRLQIEKSEFLRSE